MKNKISRNEIYSKLAKWTPDKINKLGLSNAEFDYLKNKILGTVLSLG